MKKQYIITVINPRTGTCSIEITSSEESVGDVIDNLGPHDLWFVNETYNEIRLHDGRCTPNNN